MINRTRVLFFSTVSKGLLFLFLGGYAGLVHGAEPTTGPLAGTTAAHNAIRQALNNGQPPVPGAVAQPVACPAIPDFTWSDTVATSAQAWADGCSLNHEGPTNPYGENLSLAGAGFGLTGPTSAVSWADEVKDGPYDYNTHTCGQNPAFPGCGHYTAVAWASTTEVGCGFATCGGTEWLVCRYNPGGNVNIADTRPYCTATQTTNCDPGPGVCGGGGNQLLTVAKDGTGAGTVTSAPAGIDCGADCNENYPDNTQVTLTAAAAGGSNFIGWGGDCLFAAANPTCQITMNAAKNVTATFNTGGGGNACTGAVDLVCGVPLNGTTVGATADFDGYACAGGAQAGTDVVHKLVSAQAGQVTVDLAPNAGDLDLFVLNGCNTTNCLGGSENFPGPLAEQVVFTAAAGQTYDVIVEDFNSVGDTYVLTATCPGGGCNAPDGQDQNLANTTENANRTVHVCGTITTGAAYVVGGVGGAAHVTLIAPTSMKFGNGLSVKANGGMTAKHN